MTALAAVLVAAALFLTAASVIVESMQRLLGTGRRWALKAER